MQLMKITEDGQSDDDESVFSFQVLGNEKIVYNAD